MQALVNGRAFAERDGRQMTRLVVTGRITIRNTIAQARIDGSGQRVSPGEVVVVGGCGQMQYRRRAGDGGGHFDDCLDERQDLEATGRASTFFKAAQHLAPSGSWGGWVESEGAKGALNWPTGVELHGPPVHCIHPRRTHEWARTDPVPLQP